jgi:hypothetical protein
VNHPLTGLHRPLALAVALALAVLSGCAVVSNPVAEGIPVRRLPPEVFAESRENDQPITLTLLRQDPPAVYKIAPGDVLGVWVEGMFGEKNVPPPTRVPETGNVPPSLGYPVPVRENGTVPLPLIEPVKVEGLSLVDAQKEITKAYTETKKILKPGPERVIVTLVKPRTYRVMVLRDDAGGSTFSTGAGGFSGAFLGGGASFTESRKTAGYSLDLPAYENDVLNALTRTGGLPGTDAENEIILERGAARDQQGFDPSKPDSVERFMGQIRGRAQQTIRIPLRVRPGQELTLSKSDVILDNGDVIYVRARRGDVFYTGGLLPARAFPLPRDRDLDILQALALVGAPLVNGTQNANNLTGQINQSGLGFPSPSQVTVIRKTCNGSQIPILVDINRAFRDPRERILVQAGDFIILQQSVPEGIGQYLTTQLRFNVFGFLIRRNDLTFTGTANAP